MPRKLLAAILLCACSMAGAGINTWTAIGPTGGSINHIVFGGTTGTVFAAASGGFYRSTDSGASWLAVKTDFMNGPLGVAIDPSDPSRLYVMAQDWPSLYVSTDGGATLLPVSTVPTTVNLGLGRSMAVGHDGGTIFLTSGARVFRSTDGGQTWAERTPVSTDPLARILRLAIDPADAKRLYASAYLSQTTSGLLRSQDGGQSWEVLLSGSLPSFSIPDVAVSQANPQQLWAATSSGLFRSADYGATWTNVRTGAFTAVGLDAADPAVVYAGLDGDVVLRSNDSGATWTDVTHGHGAGQIAVIAVSPTLGGRVLLGGYSGLAGSSNGGATWQPQQAGILGSSIAGISGDPATGRIYINGSGGIHYITSASDSVLPVDNAGLRQLQQTDPSIPPPPLSISSILAQPDKLLASLATGLARSVDGGSTWTLVQVAPSDSRQLFSLAGTPDQPQTLLAAGSSRLFRSMDGGIGWSQVTAGIPSNASFGPLLVAPSDARSAYAYLYDATVTGTVNPLGIYRSTDGGLNWFAASGSGATDPRLLAVDPAVASTLYGSRATEFLRSDNGGASWTSLGWDQASWRGEIIAVAVDPRRSGTLYAASVTRIARSVDGGTTWETLRDAYALPYWSPILFADPGSTGSLLAGTSAHGLQKITIAPNLALEGTAPAASAGPLVFQYSFSNLGPFDATGVKVEIQWPASAGNVEVSASSGTCVVAAGSATCTTEIFRKGSTATLTLTLTPGTDEVFTVQAAVAGDQSDADTTNNAVTLQGQRLAQADLSLTATGSTTAQVGDSVSHTLTVKNTGPGAAAAPTLTFQSGGGITPSSATSPGGSCSINAASALVSCTLADMAAGATVSVTVNSSASAAGSWDLVAQVGSLSPDGSSSDNSATVRTTVTPAAASGGSGSGNGTGGSSGGERGGGGAISGWEILALLLMAGWLRYAALRSRPRRRGPATD